MTDEMKLAEYVAEFVPAGYESPVGFTLKQWRENFRKTDLYKCGDARLVWVNEGDLTFGLFTKAMRKLPPTEASNTDALRAEAVEAAWLALKERCCAGPRDAKRCVMVSEEDFRAALTQGGE